MPPILRCDSSSTFLTASAQASTTRSCSISTSPATSGSIFTAVTALWPSILTVTMPPPAEPSTRISAISACMRSCICCACFIMACMLPGIFIVLRLLQIAYVAHFAAKQLAETLHIGMVEGSVGYFVLRRRGFGGGFCRRRGRYVAEYDLESQRRMAELLQRRENFFAAEIELELFRGVNDKFIVHERGIRLAHGVRGEL